MGGMAVNQLLLLSGGMDSIALAWSLKPKLSLTVDYGQLPARGEIQAASAVCAELGLSHRVLSVDCTSLGSGDLAGTAALSVAPIPEWWPYRNQLLITIAAMLALKEGLSSVVLGAVANDSSHADGGMAFLKSMDALLRSQEGQVTLEFPAIKETTVDLCKRVAVPHRVLAWAHSCHVASVGCGWCRGCVKHRESMRDLGYGEY
jgi:7-cyano-7-deazaguanine synthase